MDKKTFTQMLKTLSDVTPGGISLENRLLLLVDGHASRFDAESVDMAKKTGINIFVFPGGMTAVLQVMDQMFGPMKHYYYDFLGTAVHLAKGGVIDHRAKIGLWTEAKRHAISTGGCDLKKCFAELGIFPPDKTKALSRLNLRGESGNVNMDVINNADIRILPPAILGRHAPRNANVTRIVQAMEEAAALHGQAGEEVAEDDTPELTDGSDEDDGAHGIPGRGAHFLLSPKRRADVSTFPSS
jgi:hypothetical protein